ncbi:serine-rich adhesin for platelets [Drosophila innubila]|uniref:serine-rich adhesin for platelets n=1 Tax=Drosophila innubila TaxID=198719 RepID=UPI00148BB807|nr:serine-rich adhesin for platelets [Drosophila innubila]
MPTMTRMNRHSSSNAVEETRGRRRNASGDANKENFGIHFMSSPFGNSSLIALQDLSNVHGKSPQRRSFSEGSGPRQATPQMGALRCLPRIGGGVAGLEDSQLSSSRMGDTTLDRMLDAIIESARKEVRCKSVTATATTTVTALPATTLADGEWSESSIHEMEVRTPTHLKRQRVVRRKNQQKAASNNATTNTNNSSSTTTTTTTTITNRQSGLRRQPKQPNLDHIPSIKRCLSFSSSTSSDLEDDEHFAKRSSMASSASASASASASVSISASTTHSGDFSSRGSIDLSITYNVQQQQLNVHVIRCRDLQRSHGSGSINAYVKVALATGQQHHPTTSVATSSTSGGNCTGRFQRTAVHRHSSRPYFDERFNFHVEEGMLHATSNQQQLQLAVWHRDRHLKRSEFLGCLTFPLSALAEQSSFSASGSYKLHAQGCLHSCRSQQHAFVNVTPTSRPQQQQQQGEKEEQGKNKEQQQLLNFKETGEINNKMTTMAAAPLKANTTNNISTVDDVISISIDSKPDEAQLQLQQLQQPHQPMVLSKKALHQRDADENLFLRFLELDPPADGNANNTTATVAGTGSSNANANMNSITNANSNNANHMNGGNATRRCSTLAGRQPTGRTPFTMTRRLTRTEERGFGFSIVWTHPPRVEKVEAGLSADRCGILPGDYVIFVDKHNVVTMPEADVLNLIRSQGSSLTLEIFRRSGAGANMANNITTTSVTVNASLNSHNSIQTHAQSQSQTQTHTQTYSQSQQQEHATTTAATTATAAATTATTPAATTMLLQRTSSTRAPFSGNNQSRPATACSGTTSSIEAAKRRLHLPQVTFSKESIVPITDNRRRFLLQLISREQNFTAALHFGIQRFVQPLVERKDLISPNDHRTLFQNIDELLRIAEDILEQLCSNDQDQEPHMNFASRVYLSKTTAICAAYKKYCNGIKRADCVLVNKSRQTGSEFISFITEPAVPRKRPDLTMFIHRPLQHFREILKLMQLLASNCHVDTEEHKNFSTVINELQAAYREITVSSGLMEPLGEGRPLLTLQDLESRMVFTKCKPFTLAVQGRQWIFGGDLSRVEGRSIKPYWTLLFSDIIVFAKVSRDRVLFITEEPVPIANVVDSCFHMRKKTTEFRLTVDPNGRLAESPTGYCAPDLTRTPKRGARRKSLILRAPSLELKAVWQNLLQRQIFLVNAALGSTPLSSPLDSPDVLNTLVPLSDIGITSASMGSMKLPSLDSINLKQQKQQVRLFRSKRLDSADSYENLQRLASALVPSVHQAGGHVSTSTSACAAPCITASTQTPQQLCSASLPSRTTSPARRGHASSCGGSMPNGVGGGGGGTQTLTQNSAQSLPSASSKCLTAIPEATAEPAASVASIATSVAPRHAQKLLEFSLSSVGRSFIDDSVTHVTQQVSLTTPETPTPNISPSSQVCNSDAFSNDFVPPTTSTVSVVASTTGRTVNATIPLAEFGGSWDLLELDLQLNEVNLDPCYDTDVEECIFLGDGVGSGSNANAGGCIRQMDDDDNDDRLLQQRSTNHGHAVEQIELLIDEKCRILNKTGTPKSSALHLANWMKGQLDKQQQQARLVAIARSQENVSADDEQLIFNSDSEQDERIIYWTRQQLEKRTKELNLAKENGTFLAKPNFGGKRLSGVEELSMCATSDIYSEAEVVPSQISQSHSTTSDSQITVRSSPIVLDKLAVCRHCHKNCQQSAAGGGGGRGSAGASGAATAGGVSSLLCNSLKVQHSQSSPNRCCKLNGIGTAAGAAAGTVSGAGDGTGTGTGTGTATGSVTSMSSSTITGELSSKVVASSSRRETGDTESDVAQLITDELSLSQSEATDDSVGAMPNSSSSSAAVADAQLRVLGQQQRTPLANGHCSASVSVQPQPPPRRTRIVAHSSQEPTRPCANQQVKAIVTITETARIMRSTDRSTAGSASGSISGSPAKYAACRCRCTPEDFTQTQMAPDKMEQQTCKLLESPKQKATAVQRQEDDQLSLMLIGLAQFAPTIKLCGQENRSMVIKEANPTIAVVPPTPDAVLTKTTTHVWDNSGGASGASGAVATASEQITTATTSTTTAKQPRQAIIENIPEDSCDESPLEEEPPYRPMGTALRRFGTMSSLEKLPSDEQDDDQEPYTQNGLNEQKEAINDGDNDNDNDNDNDTDNDGEDDIDIDADADDDDEDADKALAQNLNELATCSSVTITNGDVLASGAWTNRAGAFVSDKMSFFEESRAFIDKYLGRWNANEQSSGQGQSNQTASETDEQMDECTSGATSGEEVWGTPTSGGDNDDMQLINSENTHSSPTKSSTSLNDDDDTELMMDELLMAPPMTASTIRGLLPRFYRRRLEPLFEEETESDEEKTQQDSDDIKKGEATTNGHYLEDLAGSSSDEAAPSMGDRQEGEVEEEEEDLDLDVESHSSEDRLLPNLATTASGPRPLSKPLTTIRLLPTTAITNQNPFPTPSQSPAVPLPPPVASSCEYLLEQRPSVITAMTLSTTTITSVIATTMTMTMSRMMTTTPTTTTTTMTTTMMTTVSRAPSSITTTTSSGSGTINSAVRAIVKPPRFIPPPPPPRRLLLTQTNLSAAPVKAQPPQRKSGATADSGCSAVVVDVANDSPTIVTGSRTMPANTRTSVPSVALGAMSAAAGSGQKRPSSTIIETCLLGAAPQPASATLSATVSRMAKPSRANISQISPVAVAPQQQQQQPPPPPEEEKTKKKEGEDEITVQRSVVAAPAPHFGCGLSPRLEMRLALNHDILGDEDLICYEPGPDLTTILGHDLSTFHRLTGRDLLSRSATNRVQPKEAVISYSQQRNSKMDTPTVNRRPRPTVSAASGPGTRSRSSSSHGSRSPSVVGSVRAVVDRQRPHPNPNTWNSSASAARAAGGSGNVADSSINCSNNSGGSKLGDLEILARREKTYCMSQLRSGCQVRATSATTTKTTTTTTTTTATTTTTMPTRRDCSLPTSQAAAAVSLTRTMSTTSMDAVAPTTTATTTTTRATTTEACLETEAGKSNRLINFIKRRNSEITASSSSNSSNPNNNSDSTCNEQPQLMLPLHPSHSQSGQSGQLLRQSPDVVDMAQMSPRKDNDKPSLNRRLWKQITKRRRTNSVSQIVAG